MYIYTLLWSQKIDIIFLNMTIKIKNLNFHAKIKYFEGEKMFLGDILMLSKLQPTAPFFITWSLL